MRVLIIEDEQKLATNISQMLQESLGCTCEIAYDGQDGLHKVMDLSFNLIILDLSLPIIDGMDVLISLRQNAIATPVLILTAKKTKEDIIAGLSEGSDDYMTKPFDMAEFIERCRALIRRSFGIPSPVINIDKLKINTLSKQVTYNERPIDLTSMEYKTLLYMVYKAGRVVSKSELLDVLYGSEWQSYSNTIEVFVSTIRKKIDPANREKVIKTARGHGYIIENS